MKFLGVLLIQNVQKMNTILHFLSRRNNFSIVSRRRKRRNVSRSQDEKIIKLCAMHSSLEYVCLGDCKGTVYLKLHNGSLWEFCDSFCCGVKNCVIYALKTAMY